MSGVAQLDGGVRARTRKAILDAAITVIAENPVAPLGDVAAAAGVGRSTLHRYFPERNDLIRALALHVHALSNDAIERADPTCGPPVDALRRVVECQLDLGPIVPFVYNEPTIVADAEMMAYLDTGDEAISEVLDRAAGRNAPALPGWSRRVFWAVLQAGYEAAKQDGTPRHQIVDAIMATLTQGVITPGRS
mgnify:CR=1 FL=1